MSNNAHDRAAQEQHYADIFARLHEQDIEQFYAHYQLWVLRRRLPLLEKQIEALREHLAENQHTIEKLQPSALALAVLVRLQSNGVNDTNVLDMMLDRGEDWLDRMMQRLDYCEQVEDFIQGDYTQWCIRSLEGAYDWIDSLLGSIKENESPQKSSGSEAVATEEQLLHMLSLDDEEGPLASRPQQLAASEPSAEVLESAEAMEAPASLEESAEETEPELLGWKDLEDLEAPGGQPVPWYSVGVTEDGSSSEQTNSMNDWIEVLQAVENAPEQTVNSPGETSEASASALFTENAATEIHAENAETAIPLVEQPETVGPEASLEVAGETQAIELELSAETTYEPESPVPASTEVVQESENEGQIASETIQETENLPLAGEEAIQEEENPALVNAEVTQEQKSALAEEHALLSDAMPQESAVQVDESAEFEDQTSLATGETSLADEFNAETAEASLEPEPVLSEAKAELIEVNEPEEEEGEAEEAGEVVERQDEPSEGATAEKAEEAGFQTEEEVVAVEALQQESALEMGAVEKAGEASADEVQVVEEVAGEEVQEQEAEEASAGEPVVVEEAAGSEETQELKVEAMGGIQEPEAVHEEKVEAPEVEDTDKTLELRLRPQTDHAAAANGELEAAAIVNDILDEENEQEEQLAWYEYLDLGELAGPAIPAENGEEGEIKKARAEPEASALTPAQPAEPSTGEALTPEFYAYTVATAPESGEGEAASEIKDWQSWKSSLADEETAQLPITEYQAEPALQASAAEETLATGEETLPPILEGSGATGMTWEEISIVESEETLAHAPTAAANAPAPVAPAPPKKIGFWRRLFGFGRRKK